MVLVWILASTFIVSIISLVGIFTLVIKDKVLDKVIFSLVGFSAGALIGSAFLHLLPEALEKLKSTTAFYILILGIVLFFFLERYLHWRHCHESECKIHAFTYLNLIGDGSHNFLDGVLIAASFLTSIKTGLIATLAIVLHEIPHELGNFSVLVYGGFTKRKALFYNFISALMAMLGALVGYLISDIAAHFSVFILPLAAGGFIYIASSDLIPQIHKESNLRQANLAFLAFLFGIIFMALAKQFLPE